MTGGHRAEAWVRASVALYRLLLRRYPGELRRRFGRDMLELFEAMVRDGARQGGARGVLDVWGRVLRDWTRPLPGTLGADASSKHREGGMGGDATMGEGIREDVRAAWRSLAREPRFTLMVTGVLAWGIALNAATFSVVNAYLLRPLPYPAAERIVQVRNAPGVSWTEVEPWFERAVSWDLDVFTLLGDDGTRLVRGSWITPDFLDIYGVRPALGRTFRPEEVGPGAAPVALISHGLWQERFGGDPAVVGRSFEAFTSDRPDHSESFRIVGVLPADYWHVNRFTEVLVPIREERQLYAGRLRADVPLERAEAGLTELARARMESVPEDYRAELVPLQEWYVASVRPMLMVLQAAVLLVLLIAVANALVLLLVRGARREREFGVRRALGARAGRVVRQLLAEGTVLAAGAATAGLALSGAALAAAGPLVQAWVGTAAPGGAAALELDGTVVGATVALAAATALLFGIVPFLAARGGTATDLLRGRGGGEGPSRARLRAGMVAGEVALSMALLAGAALMVRSAFNLQRSDLGFDPAGVITGELGLRRSAYEDPDRRVAVLSGIARQVRELPGVVDAGLSRTSPFGGYVNAWPVESGDGGGTPLSRGEATVTAADAGYFSTLGIEVVAGRGFADTDVAASESVAVVSRSLARSLWPAGAALDARLRMVSVDPGGGEPEAWMRVVGVVSDVEYDLRVDEDGQVYTPFTQDAGFWMDLVVRSRPGAGDPSGDIGRIVRAMDPEIPWAESTDLPALVAAARAPTRFTAMLLTGFAAFAALLAALGLYGVVAYAARQRRRDVAIRMALGADAGAVSGLFIRQGMLVVVAGVAAGLLGGLVLGRALAGQLHGVRPDDPLTHGAVAVALLATAAVAVWLPARGAARTDPMKVLREE